MIPAQVNYDPNATPPQFTDNEDYRVEPGTHIRVKIMGTRSEVGEMWAIGTINEDYLGYVIHPCPYFDEPGLTAVLQTSGTLTLN